jgi:hypothetical protein
VVHALIFTARFSRHCFVWLSHRQTTEAVIAGCEAAWAFFGGIFKTLIPDNTSAVVDGADLLEPRFNQVFVEYAQARGFKIDPARVRSPQDKPRVERQVQFVRGSFFAGESFIDLADAQRRAEIWCRERAGLRVHGTTEQRPAEAFAAEEQPRLLPAPATPYDVPICGSTGRPSACPRLPAGPHPGVARRSNSSTTSSNRRVCVVGLASPTAEWPPPGAAASPWPADRSQDRRATTLDTNSPPTRPAVSPSATDVSPLSRRCASATGANGSAPPPTDAQPPTSVRTPSARARATSSVTRRVLSTPASTYTTVGVP